MQNEELCDYIPKNLIRMYELDSANLTFVPANKKGVVLFDLSYVQQKFYFTTNVVAVSTCGFYYKNQHDQPFKSYLFVEAIHPPLRTEKILLTPDEHS